MRELETISYRTNKQQKKRKRITDHQHRVISDPQILCKDRVKKAVAIMPPFVQNDDEQLNKQEWLHSEKIKEETSEMIFAK